MLFDRHEFAPRLPTREEALRGRDTRPFAVPEHHRVLGNRIEPPFPPGLAVADFALGCFWGAERKFWQTEGVWTTAVGYQGGFTKNPTYEEACSGRTGHTEAVRVVYDPKAVSYEQLLKVFWESHDPTQGFRQGNDVGTQYRSAVYTHSDADLKVAEASRDAYQAVLTKAGLGTITTEIRPADTFHYAEAYHQQYLDRVPNGYCGLGGTGVELGDPTQEGWGSCPIGITKADD